MRPISKLKADITKTAGSGMVQFLLTLMTTPLMTRLFSPEAYSAFGTINMIATNIIGLGLLSLPNAYPMEKDPQRRAELLRTMLMVLGLLGLFAVPLAFGLAVAHLFPAGEWALALLPMLVITYGMRQIVVGVATRGAHFSSIALAQVIEPVCARGGSVAFGAVLGGHPAFILLAAALGHLATATTIIKTAFQGTIAPLLDAGAHFVYAPREILRRYRDFALFNTFSQQPHNTAMLGVQLAIIPFFSNHLAGQYILAISILTMPVSLIALTTAPVVYHHFIEIGQHEPAKLVHYLRRTMGMYLLAGVVILSPLLLLGGKIFALVFGAVWEPAGHIAGILSFAYIGTFAVIGVQSVFRVAGRMKTQFHCELIASTLAFVAAMGCFAVLEFIPAMACLSFFWACRNAVLLYACDAAARDFIKRSHTEIA